jgi:hypothetical protein
MSTLSNKIAKHVIAGTAFAALLSSTLPSSLLAAPVEGLTPATVKRIKTANANYKECQQAAITALNSKLINQVKFNAAVDACRERFPAISLYSQCKRDAVAAAAATKKDPAEALAACKKLLVAASFDREQPVPFFIHEGQLFFGGVGMNKVQSAATLDPPNFDCDRLNKSILNPLEAQYILFGNHPKVFKGLGPLSIDNLAKTLQIENPAKANSKKGAATGGFGRVFGSLDKENSTVFFPAAACDFDGQLGRAFSGLSAYYLIDKGSGEVTPYFGIAYYRPGVKDLTTKDLVTRLIETMNAGGTGYHAIIKNDTTAFVANSDFTEYDDEKDPRNVCKEPRANSLIGIVQAAKDNPARPRYLVVANVKNLCEYGDRLASRLLSGN